MIEMSQSQRREDKAGKECEAGNPSWVVDAARQGQPMPQQVGMRQGKRGLL